MRVGTAWEDITPDRPLDLLGQMHRRVAERTRDPLTANAIAFCDGSFQSVVVSVDIGLIPDALMAHIKDAINENGGIDAKKVLIASTHTHVAPCTGYKIAGEADEQWIDSMVQKVVTVVRKSLDDLEDAELFAGNGYIEHMGWNRRGMRSDGTCRMYWGSWKEDFVGIEGPRDGHVGVLFARRKDGTVKAVIPSFATHPNCVEGETFYSADIPGEVRRVLRSVLGENVGVAYLTGAAGDTAPSIMVNNPKSIQPWRGEAGLIRSGEYLGAEILSTIASQIEPMHEPKLHLEQQTLEIPVRPWDENADRTINEFSGGMREYFENSRNDWPRIMAEENPVITPVSVLRIGDTAICTNPGELFCLFGLKIKEKSPARVTLIAELTDGFVGYIPTPEAIMHGGYSAASGAHIRMQADAGWTIVDTTSSLLQRAFQ